MDTHTFLQVLIDALPIPVFYKDLSGRYTGCNRAFCDLIGRPREELVGRTVYDIAPVDIADTYFQKDRELFASGGIQVYEWKIRDQKGQVREVIFHKATFVNETGEPAGLIGAIFDITESKKMEDALRRSEQQFKTLVANVPGIIYRCANDPHWTMQYISDEIQTISGYPADEFVNNRVRSYASVIHPEDQAMVDRIVQEGVKKRQPYTIEYRIVHARGAARWVYERGQGVFDKKGKLNFLDGVILDMSELKTAQEELRRTYELLMKTQNQLVAAAKMEVVGKLASGVAHEVKNPLAIILMGIDYLRHELKGEKHKNIHAIGKDMHEAAVRADRIVNDLLDFSKASELTLSSCSIHEVLEKSLFLVKYQMDKNRIEFKKNLSPDLPQVVVDENKIIQVFVNLFLNGIQAVGPKGSLELMAYEKKFAEASEGIGRRRSDHFYLGEPVVVVEISDTGPGIPPDILENIFDPFVTTKRFQGGTGLGLSVVHNIVDMHKGVIKIENKKGGGVRATVMLKMRPQGT